VWRYVYKRFPLKYDPLYWGAVFPLGMYAASTHEMSLALSFDFLALMPQIFLYAALLAWLVVISGLIVNIARRIGGYRLPLPTGP
jgi:tellurite resistance protein TehA-like permease